MESSGAVAVEGNRAKDESDDKEDKLQTTEAGHGSSDITIGAIDTTRIRAKVRSTRCLQDRSV